MSKKVEILGDYIMHVLSASAIIDEKEYYFSYNFDEGYFMHLYSCPDDKMNQAERNEIEDLIQNQILENDYYY